MRRVFWLSLGAALGVTGYRRATALARSLRPQTRPDSLAGFAADVREGMALYMERQAGRAPSSTLEAHAKRVLGRAGPGGHSAARGTPPNRRRPGTPRGPEGPATSSRALGRAPSRNDEPKDGR